MSSDATRDRLLSVAREIVANRGYLGLSVRTVSAAAGVTPEVARRYFKNRDALFAAVLKLPVDPAAALPTLLVPGIEGMGERLVRFTFDILRDEHAREELVSLARAGATTGRATLGLQEFIEHGVVDRIASAIGVPDARMRAALISSYLLGVALTRYGLRVEPLASAKEEEVIRLVAPVIQDLLDPRKPLTRSAQSAQSAQHARPPAAAPTPPEPTPEPPDPRQTRTFDPDPASTAARLAAAESGQDA